MISTFDLGSGLSKRGFKLFSGVPCSYLKSLINYAIDHCDYIGAANEGDAVAIASGAALGGMRSVVLMQNSGLSNAVSPLTSLNFPFRLPVLGFVSLRGEEGLGDEPQHELMGPITTDMLEVMKIPWEFLTPDKSRLESQLAQALDVYLSGRSFFFVVKKGILEDLSLKQNSSGLLAKNESLVRLGNQARHSRNEVLLQISEALGSEWLVIATTGHTGRELYEVDDRLNQIYMVGSMGCASSMGLGLARSQPQKKVLVIDGDGALLMRMGNLATLGAYSPKNLFHLCLDNGIHASTGGQATVSCGIDIAGVAAACGYTRVLQTSDVENLVNSLIEFNGGLTFTHFPITGAKKAGLGRPAVSPYEVKQRFMLNLGIEL
jgi:phosphonopyruvate decarboxylase